MSAEVLTRPHNHFETHHGDNGEIVICMQSSSQCSVLVEIRANNEEQAILIANTEKALSLLDNFFDGRFAEVFAGLQIKIGDGLVEGGAEARVKENKILADRQKMLLSLKDSEVLLSEYFETGERTRVMSDEEAAEPGSVWQYELVHEIGHFLDEQTPGPVGKRVSTSESPTKYGREPDDWHDTKDHEAFADGFTHMVFGAPVSSAMKEAVTTTVNLRIAELEKSTTGKDLGEL